MCQAFIEANAGLLSIGPLGINLSEILIKIQNFSFMKCIWKSCLWNGGHFVQGEMSWVWSKTHKCLTMLINSMFPGIHLPISFKVTSPHLNIKTIFPGMGIPMLKIRRSWDRLIFNMGITILVRRHLYIDTAPMVTSVTLGQSHDCPNTSGITLKSIWKSSSIKSQQNIAKLELCAFFMVNSVPHIESVIRIFTSFLILLMGHPHIWSPLKIPHMYRLNY